MCTEVYIPGGQEPVVLRDGERMPFEDFGFIVTDVTGGGLNHALIELKHDGKLFAEILVPESENGCTFRPTAGSKAFSRVCYRGDVQEG